MMYVYRGELKGYQKILKSIGSYLKDEINLELLFNVYHIVHS